MRSGLGSVDPPSGGQQLEGPLATHDPGQGDRDPEALVEAEPGEVGGEPAVRGPHPEVGGEGQSEATADGRTLDRGHDGERAVEEVDRPGVEGAQGLGFG